MPVIDIPKLYANNEDLYEEHLDAAFEYIEGALNTTKLDNTNIQDGGIDTDCLASTCVTDAKLATDAVTTVKIQDLAVSTAKLAATSVTAAKLAADAVETAKIKDGAVTPAKKAALGQQVSASCGTYTTTDTSYADVTNLSVTITTTGRPVFLGIIQDGSAVLANQSAESIYFGYQAAGNFELLMQLLRDGSRIAAGSFMKSGTAVHVPPPFHIDTPGAGTYVYKVQIANGLGGISATVGMKNAKLIAFEL